MTLEEATKQFESEFDSVADYDRSDDPRAVRGNNQYFVLTSCGPKLEGSPVAASFLSEDEAVTAWLDAAHKQHQRVPGKSLYWRTRPEMTSGRKRTKPFGQHPFGMAYGPVMYSVYSRMTHGT